MGHFDHIPAGKREIFNKDSNTWELVDLTESTCEDLRIILEERNSEIEELKKQISHSEDIIKKMNAKIIALESNLGKKSK